MKLLAMDSSAPAASSTTSPLASANDSPLIINILPERPGHRDCAFFLRTGTCRFGSNCRFNHPGLLLDQRQQIVETNNNSSSGTSSSLQLSPYGLQKSELPERIGQPECQFYLKTGTCKFGAQCKYHHPQMKGGRGGPPQLNYLGLPIRLGEKECVYYLRTGTCKFGTSCKFHHPEPAGIGTIFPSLSPLYSNGALVSPIPIPSWSMVRPSYLAASGFPAPSPYMHVYASPQNIPMPGWNSYQSPSNHVTSDGQQMEYGNGVQANGGWKSNLEDSIALPQRPGQPDCHFYMKTGLCKFGANCKYHHPKDITIPSLPASMSPMGLPLRPGMPQCTFYLKNGICKFGPICKFDHPIGPISPVSLLPRSKGSPRVDDVTSTDESQMSPGPPSLTPAENGRCEDATVNPHEEQQHHSQQHHHHHHHEDGNGTSHTTE